MKLKKTYPSGGERTIRELCRRSMMGSMVLDCLAIDTTEEAIIEKMRALYDVPGETAEADVRYVITELRKCGALEESC